MARYWNTKYSKPACDFVGQNIYVDDPRIELNSLASHVSTSEDFLEPLPILQGHRRVIIRRADWLNLTRYNTAVFSSLSANAYDYFVVSEDFFSSSATYNVARTEYRSLGGGVPNTMHSAFLSGNLTNVTSAQCMEAYAINFVSKSRNVLLVTTDANTNNNSLLYVGNWEQTSEVPYAWICGDGWDQNPYEFSDPVCTAAIATAAASDWKVNSHPISYCMIQEVVEECQLSFSLLIMLVVITVNASKTIISECRLPTFLLISTKSGFDLKSFPYSRNSISGVYHFWPSSFSICRFRLTRCSDLDCLETQGANSGHSRRCSCFLSLRYRSNNQRNLPHQQIRHPAQ